jgi:hypothetical protein
MRQTLFRRVLGLHRALNMDNFTKETTEGLAYLDSLDGMEQIDALVLGVSNVLSRYEAPTTSEAVTGR